MQSLRLDLFRQQIKDYERQWAFFDRYQEPLPKKEIVKYNGHGAEILELIDFSQKNKDIPDEIHGFEQGWADRENTHLDFQELNDRDFRQRCVIINGRLYALYEKRKVDFKPPQHLDPEWIMKKLHCGIEPATLIAIGFRALGLKRSECLKLLFKDAIFFADIRIPQPVNADLLAKQLTETADLLDEVTITWSNCINSEDVERDYLQIHGIKPHREADPFWQDLEVDEEPFIDDDLEYGEDNPFGAFQLFWGNEACSHEFLTMLRFASWDRLDSIIKELPYKDKAGVRTIGRWMEGQYGQYFKRFKFWYLTDSQISQIWEYIKARRIQLKNAIVADNNLSVDARLIIQYISTLKNKRLTAALIYAWRDEREFNLFGVPLQWSAKPSQIELSVVWDHWHKMK